MDFELEPMYDGDIVYDLRFVIRSLPNGVEAQPSTSFGTATLPLKLFGNIFFIVLC